MAEKEIKQRFTTEIPTYHVHVYKVVSMCEFDMLKENEMECLDDALLMGRQAHEGKMIGADGKKWKTKKPDCEYVAVSFKYANSKRSGKVKNDKAS